MKLNSSYALLLGGIVTSVMLLGAASAIAQTGPNSGRPASSQTNSPAPNFPSGSGTLLPKPSTTSTALGGDSSFKSSGLGALVSPAAQNGGAISAHVTLASVDGEQRVVVDLYGDRLVSIATSKADEHKFEAGTQVPINSGQASRIVDTAVNMSGVVQARSAFVDSNGEVVLDGPVAGGNTAGTPNTVPKKIASLSKQDIVAATATTPSNSTALQVKVNTVDILPPPTFNPLLRNFDRSGFSRTWGDVLAIGAAFNSNGVLFTGYFYDLFDTVVTLASARSGGDPAIDYAACYLGSKGAIDCTIKPGSL